LNPLAYLDFPSTIWYNELEQRTGLVASWRNFISASAQVVDAFKIKNDFTIANKIMGCPCYGPYPQVIKVPTFMNPRGKATDQRGVAPSRTRRTRRAGRRTALRRSLRVSTPPEQPATPSSSPTR
jgi:hypothetical protein